MKQSQIRFALLALLFVFSSQGIPSENKPTVTIGLVDTFSPTFFIESYSPTVDHLMESLTQYQFNLVDINPGNILEDIERYKPDFLISNAFTYVSLMQTHGALQVATKENKETSNLTDSVASTIIVRSDSSIKTLADARGKKAAVSDLESFGGWLIAKGEMLSAGSNPDKFFSEIIETKYGVPDVFLLLKHGFVTVGVVESCELEKAIQSGQIKEGDFRVLNQRLNPQKCLVSTPGYPDVVFFSLAGVAPSITKDVTVELLTMPSVGLDFNWTITNNFLPTYNLMQSLRLGPFNHDSAWSVKFLLEKYKKGIYFAVLLLFFLLLHVFQINYLVRKRTGQLSKALKETKKFYLESQKSKQKLHALERMSIVSQISSMFAHEIKQPITNIGYYAGALSMLLEQKPTKDSRAQEIITLLQNELQKSTQIVEHVRSLVKKRPKEKKICDLGGVVSNALGQGLYAQAVENNVPKGEFFTLGDAFELEFIVLNFVRNAKSAVKGVVNPQISVSVSEAGAFWKLSVRDNGPKLDQLAFENLGKAIQSSKPDGLGFGLSICNAIAESSGGHLEFERGESSGVIASLFVEKFITKEGGGDDEDNAIINTVGG